MLAFRATTASDDFSDKPIAVQDNHAVSSIVLPRLLAVAFSSNPQALKSNRFKGFAISVALTITLFPF
jgi:hypothetical protein